MAMDNPVADATLLNSIIGEGTRFKGEFEIDGLLRIDGDFLGTIRTSGKILVGLNGRAQCNIYAETVVVGGVVKGNIFCTDRVIVLSTGMVLGNVSSPRLVVEEGVILQGACRVGGEGREEPAASSEPQRGARAVELTVETVRGSAR